MDKKKVIKPEPLLIHRGHASGILEILPVAINKDYIDKWHVHQKDFVGLTLNGKLISETLYRIGGMGNPNVLTQRYFMLLKYREDQYCEKILKITKSKDGNFLKAVWCILDQEGNEKKDFESYATPYLIKNSCIYTINNEYYNIETNELYCQAYKSVESEDFLFLQNEYDKDHSKRGILKINKSDGTYEFIK